MPQDEQKHAAQDQDANKNQRGKYQIYSKIAFAHSKELLHVKWLIYKCEEEIEERNNGKIENVGAHAVEITRNCLHSSQFCWDKYTKFPSFVPKMIFLSLNIDFRPIKPFFGHVNFPTCLRRAIFALENMKNK